MTRRHALALLPAAALAGCEEERPPAGPRFPKVKKRVLATTHFTAGVAEAIGGRAVEVRCFLPPGVSPHGFTPAAPDLAKLDTSDIVLVHGLGLESRWPVDVPALEKHGATVTTVTAPIPPERLLRPSGPGGPPDPHVWTDPDLAVLMIEAVETTLKKALPKLEEYLHERAYRLRLAFQDTREFAAKRFAGMQKKDYFLLTSHDSMQYFARAFGLEARALCPADGRVPDSLPAGLAEWITSRNVRSLFREAGTDHLALRAMLKGLRVDADDIIHTLALPAAGTTALIEITNYDMGDVAQAARYNADRIVSTLEVD